MPETLGGIPIHPLVVHAVVVLIPLAALGVIAISVIPRWRGRFGVLVVAAAAVATALVPVATQSGENLEESVAESAQLERHAELGDTMIWGAIPLLVMAAALWWLGRQSGKDQPPPRWLAIIVPVLGVVVAGVALVQVVLIGHSGAKSVWG
jgi:uncharacterized membrane protein